MHSPAELRSETTSALEQRRAAARRLLTLADARDHLYDFIRVMMPDEDGEPGASEYQRTPVGDLLNRIIEDVESGKRNRVAVSIPPQHGKPVAEHELVLMGDGSRKPLRDVVVGDRVITHRGLPRRVAQVFVQGELETLRIRTACGREVMAAPDHPFLTPRGWVLAGELTLRDTLAVLPGMIFDGWRPAEDVTAATARLLGYLVGDGCTAKNGATIGASITCVDPVEREDIRWCAAQLGFNVREKSSASRATQLSLSGGVRDFLREHELAGKGSHDKRVPAWVFTAGDDAVANFLGAYFACDGSINLRGGARKDICAEFYSVSKGLLQDVQHLLTRFGVQSRLSEKLGRYKGEVHHSWRLSVTSQSHLYRLSKRLPIYHEKAARLAEWQATPTEFEAPFMPDAIVSIEPSGKAPCRCLTVEEDHSFVAADFVVHNTLHLSQMGPAWILGRNPRARIIVATYNEIRAAELGDDFRRIVTSPVFKSIFPKFELATGSKSKTAMKTIEGGRIVFVGLGGTVTGRTADYFIIDDPMKDDEELQSRLFRDKMWKWFYAVAFSRGSKRTRIVVLHTRWHSDDLIGRLCDPSHPDRHRELAGIADDWYYLNISGVIKDPKLANLLGLVLKVPTDPKVIAAFGPEPSVALWEENKDLAFFAQWRAGEPRTFSALVMGMPTIEDGEYFTASSLLEYNIADLPKHLSIYGASDHAVSEQQYRDKSVIGCVGVDENDDIWILPDIMWSQVPTDKAVEELISQFKIHRPLLWWMEAELISKSFGPFLHKRMVEEKTYVTLNPVTPSKDKPTRARAIQGRMSMGKVHFPRFAPWWQEARSQLLQFPYGAHDDFVDWLSHVGMGLMQEQRAHAPQQTNVVQLRPAQRVAVETMKRVMAGPQREHPRAAGW